MQFNSTSRGGGDLASLFSPEELALLQDIPKGTLLELKNSYLLVTWKRFFLIFDVNLAQF